jgi:hypothetical protein
MEKIELCMVFVFFGEEDLVWDFSVISWKGHAFSGRTEIVFPTNGVKVPLFLLSHLEFNIFDWGLDRRAHLAEFLIDLK